MILYQSVLTPNLRPRDALIPAKSLPQAKAGVGIHA
jgi:hypothetical protein